MFVASEERVVFAVGDMRARGESVFEVLRDGEGDECVGANGVGIFGGNCDAVSVWSNGSSVCVWEWSVRYDDLRRRRDEVRRRRRLGTKGRLGARVRATTNAFIVVCDLDGQKDTVKILKDLQSAFENVPPKVENA